MALAGKQVSVGTSPTQLATNPTGGQPSSAIAVKNKTGAAASVFLGGAGVTSSSTGVGYELEVGETVSVDLGQGERLYGIVASGTVTVHVLESGI